MQIADINKGTYIQTYQSTMSLIVIDFTFLEGRDNEVVKELAVADSHNKSRHMSLRDRTAGKKYLCLMLESIRLLAMGVTGMMVIFHIQSWKLFYVTKYHLLLQFIALDLRKQTLLAVLSTEQLLILPS